jgi:hypothetical protein
MKFSSSPLVRIRIAEADKSPNDFLNFLRWAHSHGFVFNKTGPNEFVGNLSVTDAGKVIEWLNAKGVSGVRE